MSPSSILDRPRVIDGIVAKEIESAMQSRELAFVVCQDGSVHDQHVIGKWNDIIVPDFDPEKTCKGKEAHVFHTHVVSSSLPSLRDTMSHSNRFRSHPSLKSGCSVGIDGVFCIGRNGVVEMKKFTPDQEKRLLKSSNVTKWTGDQVFCDNLVKDGESFQACTIQNLGAREISMGIFKEVSMHGGSTWSGDEQSDVSMFSPLPSMQLECFGSTGGKMQLSCVVREKTFR